LIRLEKQGWVFMDSAWSAKPYASWRWDPRVATQGELQGELHKPTAKKELHSLYEPTICKISAVFQSVSFMILLTHGQMLI